MATGSNAKHALTTEAENPTAGRGPAHHERPRSGRRLLNSNAIKAAEQLTERLRGEGKEVDTYIVGRKGVAYYGFREREVAESWTGFTDSPRTRTPRRSRLR